MNFTETPPTELSNKNNVANQKIQLNDYNWEYFSNSYTTPITENKLKWPKTSSITLHFDIDQVKWLITKLNQTWFWPNKNK